MAERDIGTAVRIETADAEKLTKLAKRNKLYKKEVIGLLLDLEDHYQILRPKWQERLNEALKQADDTLEVSEFEGLEDAPRSMVWANDQFNYVEKTKAGTIKITKLSKNCQEALALCKEFELQLDEEREREMLQKQMVTQDIQILDLKKLRYEGVKVPVCNKGARLSNEGKEFRGCPKTDVNKAVSVENWCKKYSRGLPCQLFAQVIFKPEEDQEPVKDYR